MINLKKESDKRKSKGLSKEVPSDFFRKEDLNRKRNNNINNFLNSYFKYIAVFLIFAFLWGGFRFFIKPSFDKAMLLSGVSTKKKKTEFIDAYSKMENYKNVLEEYSKIDQDKVNKIVKMIPNEYSRDDLFTEITYFLIKNNYKVDSIAISNPLSESNEEEGVPPVTNRRTTTENINKEEESYVNYIKSLPPEIGTWVVTLKLSEVDYFDLKELFSILENNLKLIDVFSVDFQPSINVVNIKILTYYYKN